MRTGDACREALFSVSSAA